ncbi:hypothetical protein [Vibrio sp. WXL210]|uniref:hypothetical protein n=1 Tax=Vibrio sp. WXL210 TaxID=3450709 RepID=UPI003EC884BD
MKDTFKELDHRAVFSAVTEWTQGNYDQGQLLPSFKAFLDSLPRNYVAYVTNPEALRLLSDDMGEPNTEKVISGAADVLLGLTGETYRVWYGEAKRINRKKVDKIIAALGFLSEAGIEYSADPEFDPFADVTTASPEEVAAFEEYLSEQESPEIIEEPTTTMQAMFIDGKMVAGVEEYQPIIDATRKVEYAQEAYAEAVEVAAELKRQLELATMAARLAEKDVEIAELELENAEMRQIVRETKERAAQ